MNSNGEHQALFISGDWINLNPQCTVEETKAQTSKYQYVNGWVSILTMLALLHFLCPVHQARNEATEGPKKRQKNGHILEGLTYAIEKLKAYIFGG